MTVNARLRLSAKDALRHPWMEDAEAVAKAQRLMGIKQPRYGIYYILNSYIHICNSVLPNFLSFGHLRRKH